jgi:hypothetical protein
MCFLLKKGRNITRRTHNSADLTAIFLYVSGPSYSFSTLRNSCGPQYFGMRVAADYAFFLFSLLLHALREKTS